MRLLCRYAGGLACLVTALALVGCGGGPGSQPEPKEIGNIAFRQGETIRTIPLSDKFSGADLTYSATTSNRSVATATVDNTADTLTVTAVGAGTANITVTAKNSQGEAKQTFTVTVPKPPAPDPVEIPDIPSLEEDATHTIPLSDTFSGENLTYRASSSNERVATVAVAAATLTVTAVGPGTATIEVTATAQGSATQTKTFTVTVPQPASEEEAPTVRTGARASVAVDQGGTETIILSGVFTGEDLDFTVESSDDTVATASESGGTLTITGVSSGLATITVTATNDAGSEEHEITVTVTAPATPTTPAPQEDCSLSGSLTISLRIIINTNKKCTLPANHSLIYDNDEVSVDGPTGNNVWTITAHKKGTYEVKINKDATAETVGTITVTVPNTPPRLIGKYTYTAASYSIGNPPTVAFELLGNTGKVTNEFNPGAFFADVDTGDDPDPPGIDTSSGTQGDFRFRVYQKPEEVLIGTDSGYVAVREADRTSGAFSKALTNGPIEAEAIILKNPNPGSGDNRTYDILLYAYDSSNGESDNPVTLRVKAQDPVSPAPAPGYSLVKGTGNTYNKTVMIGNRIGVYHKIALNQSTPTQYNFLDFITEAAIEKEIKSVDDAFDTAATTDIESTICNPLPGPPISISADNGQGDGCWSVSTSRKVTIRSPVLTEDDKSIDFRLDTDRQLNDASDVTITIGYYVVAKAAVAADPSADPPVLAQATKIEKVGDRTLTVDIHRCVDVDNCP